MRKVLLNLLLIGWMPVAMVGQVAGIYCDSDIALYGDVITLKLVVEGADGPFQMTFQRNADRPETKVGIPSTTFSWGEEITQTMTFTLLDVKNGSGKKITIDPEHRSVVVKLSGTGIEEVDTNLTFAVYPNPTQDILHIEIEGDDVQFDIFDALGKHVMSGDIHNQSIDVSDLTRGIYVLCISTKKGATSAIFLKE